MKLGDHWTLNPGIRLSWFNTSGRNYLSPEPRVSLKYVFGDWTFKTGYARMAQYVHLLSSGQISLPTDLWVPITKNIKPVTSDQFSLGVYFEGIKGWELSVEGYWKEMRNILEYKDGIIVLGSSGGWEDKVTMGNGRARGIEFYAQKTSGKVTGWVAYTLSKSDRHFPDGSINNGNRFPYKYDRRHNFNINMSWALSPSVDLNATWTYLSGGMTTLPERKTAIYDPSTGNIYPADHITSRNNYRLPPSHRLNIGANFRKVRRNGNERIWSVGIYNVYNQMNPNYVFLDYEVDENTGEEKVILDKMTILPIIPSVSYTLKF